MLNDKEMLKEIKALSLKYEDLESQLNSTREELLSYPVELLQVAGINPEDFIGYTDDEEDFVL